MAVVQFFGKDAVLEGYDFKKVDTWAIFQQKALIMSGDDREQLDTFLYMLAQSSGGAVYTLCMYNDVPSKAITNKTEYNASYGFKLEGQSTGGGNTRSMSGGFGMGSMDPVMQAVYTKLSSKMGAVVEEMLSGEKEEKPPSIMEVITGHLQEPAVAMGVIGLIDKFLSKTIGVAPAPVVPMQPAQMAAIGGIAESDNESINIRLVNAINTLEKNDSKILEHLEKLAGLSENNPAMFKTMLGMLDGM